MTTQFRSHAIFIAMLFLAACSTDCSCDGFVSQPFPPAKFNRMVPSSGVVRVTPTGLGFIEQNLPTIVEGVVPGGLSFCVPEDNGSPSVCYRGETCSNGSNGCDMTLTIDDATITPQPSDTLLIDITLGDLDERLSVGILGQDCFIDLHALGNTNLPATVDATLPMIFRVDPQSPTNDVRITTGDLDADLSNLDFAISGDLLCFAGNLGFVKDLVKDQLIGQLDPILSGVIDEQLCTSCATDPCQTGTCNADDICEFPNGECVPLPLGTEGVLQIGSVIGDFSEEPGAEVDTFIRVGDLAQVDTGLSLGLRNAYDPNAIANCVPVDPSGRDFSAAPISPTVTGNLKPNGDPFMLGVGYHERALEHMLWSVWGSGATCMRIGTDQIDLLTTGLFGAILPSIRELALNKTSELYIKIVPQQPPVVSLGANTVIDNNGTYTIDEPLMNIDWKDFDIHIYAFAQSRFTRVATIRMDLLIPVALVPTAQGEIIPILGDLGGSIMNERVIQTQLIEEDPQRLLDLIPTLIGMALPALAGSLSDPISLPEFFGFRIDIGPGDITGIDNNTQIGLFANLVIAGTPIISSLDTRILSHSVNYDKRAISGLILPRVTLSLLGISQDGIRVDPNTEQKEIEFSYRVDGGTWSLPVRGDQVTIEDPMFVIPGEHKIEIAAQYKGEYRSQDTTPFVQRVLIDYTAPDLELEQRKDHIDFKAFDDVSDVLQFRHRFTTSSNTPTWSAWTTNAKLGRQPNALEIQVEVRDEAGNVTAVTQTLRTVEQGLAPDSTSTGSPSVGCATRGSGNSPFGLWLIIAGLIVSLRRTRRTDNLPPSKRSRWAPLLFFVLMFGACDCGDDTSGDCECTDNQACVEGQCVATTCATDADCTNQICINFECVDPASCAATCECGDGEFGECDEDDACICEAYCADGCGAGEYCCYENNACETVPDPCADLTCEDGFQTELTGEPAGDSETCGGVGATCECVPIPPLDIGKHGQFSSFDQAGGVTAIANYNTTYGDLMVGLANGTDVTWYWVDGVPSDGMVTGAEDGPRDGISTKGDNIGTHTAIGIDASGNLHVFYRDEERNIMKYARGVANGAAYDFTIADFDTNGDTGYWPSVEMEGSNLHLVYSTKSVSTGANVWETQLHHVIVDPSSPANALSSTREVLDSTAARNPCGFKCDGQEKCYEALNLCGTATADCAADCGDDTCYMGTCEVVYTVPPAGYDEVVGGYTELSTTPDGLLLVYFDKFQDSIKWTRRVNGAWVPPTVVGATTGPFGSGVVDAGGNLSLVYQNRSTKELVYEGTGGVETIQNGVRDTPNWWMINDIGEDVQIRQNAAGNFVVIYQDATEHVLHRAERTAANAWSVSAIAIPGSNPYTGAHGFYISMLKEGSADTLLQTVIDNQMMPPISNPVLYE